MFNDEGVRSQNQMQGVDNQGNLKNLKVGATGALLVEDANSGEATEKIRKTIACDKAVVGTTATSIAVNKYVSQIKIANYSETASLCVVINNNTYNINSNIVVEIFINANVTDISITSSEDNTAIQYLIESEE